MSIIMCVKSWNAFYFTRNFFVQKKILNHSHSRGSTSSTLHNRKLSINCLRVRLVWISMFSHRLYKHNTHLNVSVCMSALCPFTFTHRLNARKYFYGLSVLERSSRSYSHSEHQKNKQQKPRNGRERQKYSCKHNVNKHTHIVKMKRKLGHIGIHTIYKRRQYICVENNMGNILLFFRSHQGKPHSTQLIRFR